ncbi:hypothetical protein KIN20_019311 [Parelaphostrongylus tenuis]|nr:hypothetical protein KIN20_019311 [Parelaphostrongylus tenuis]
MTLESSELPLAFLLAKQLGENQTPSISGGIKKDDKRSYDRTMSEVNKVDSALLQEVEKMRSKLKSYEDFGPGKDGAEK